MECLSAVLGGEDAKNIVSGIVADAYGSYEAQRIRILMAFKELV